MFDHKKQPLRTNISGKEAAESRMDHLISSLENEIKYKQEILDKAKKAKSSLSAARTYQDFEKSLDHIFGQDTVLGVSSLEKFLIKNDYNGIDIKENWD